MNNLQILVTLMALFLAQGEAQASHVKLVVNGKVHHFCLVMNMMTGAKKKICHHSVKGDDRSSFNLKGAPMAFMKGQKCKSAIKGCHGLPRVQVKVGKKLMTQVISGVRKYWIGWFDLSNMMLKQPPSKPVTGSWQIAKLTPDGSGVMPSTKPTSRPTKK